VGLLGKQEMLEMQEPLAILETRANAHLDWEITLPEGLEVMRGLLGLRVMAAPEAQEEVRVAMAQPIHLEAQGVPVPGVVLGVLVKLGMLLLPDRSLVAFDLMVVAGEAELGQ
jgi:hypothetical protein